ncbi:MAG: hypothetical protein AMXMBFR58_32080 [Phycisphaerae bacterium]|nr:putative membrane protein insertion efficiency factor [Phycisphaerales bacterium]MCK6476289.1 membrane protein insertion efficiency factor YidD [Phycisphaerales bacterium]
MIEDPARVAAGAACRHGERARSTRAYGWSVLPLVALVRAYQLTLSPLLGGQCRYVPTCSAYALDALRQHGPFRGTWMAARRILRCHPFARGGYDPVPPADE